MFSKIIALCAVVAVSHAGLLSAPVQYSSAAAVSSQSIVRHDESQGIATKLVAAPIAKLAVAAPVYRSAAPVYQAAAPVYQAAAPVYQAPASIAYRAAPVTKLAVAAPVYRSAAPVYQAAAPVYQAAAPIAYRAAPVAKVIAREEEYAYPKYEYSYSVSDAHTGDAKQQQEVRDGDVVKGSYSFHEADGSIRTVEYSADDHSGFNAVVHNTAPTAAPAIIKAAPVVLKAPVYAAPALQYYNH